MKFFCVGRKLKRSDSVRHNKAAGKKQSIVQEGESKMLFAITGIILAVLSMPLIIYAGERTTNRRLPRPAFVRSLSESMRRKDRKESYGPHQNPANSTSHRSLSFSDGSTVVNTPVSTGPSTPSLVRTISGREDYLSRRVDTGFSINSGETYIRGMTLEKSGLD